jgi:hypothetical protein
MDDHFKQRSKASNSKRESRDWFPQNGWQTPQQAEPRPPVTCAILDEDETTCALCEEEFVVSWDDERDAWVVRGGQRIDERASPHFGKLVHTTCM